MIEKINYFDRIVLVQLNVWSSHLGPFVNKFFAEYLIYSLPFILIVLFYFEQKAKKPVVKALFSMVVAWPIIANIINHLVKRPRPLNITGVHEILFHRPDFSFPSDHASALFAVAFSFWFSGYKKLSIWLFAMAIIISFFRVSMVIHWPTDILAGLLVGLVSAWLIYIFDRQLDGIYNFILKMLKKIKLA